MILIATVVIIFALSSAAEPNNSTRCNRFCGTDKATQTQVRYPFGFSEGCEIQLNCKDNRTIYLGDFYVYNLTSESIYVNLPAKCNRPMGEIKQLFGRNYAPTSRNNFLLQNCSRPPLGCLLSETLMKRFPEDGCESEGGNISCYSESDKGLKFTTYEALQNTTCSHLYTSMTDVSFQIVELEWLVEGRCGCVSEAACTLVWFPGAPPGYRCSCKNGFEGDGFFAGIGCRKVAVLPPLILNEPLKFAPGKHSGNTGKYIRMRIILPIVFGIVGVYIGWLICKKGKKLRAKEAEKYGNQEVESFIRNCEGLTTQRYSYSDIEKMTGSFKETLGKGGYGTVYKGNLADDREVAVKVLDETKGGNGEEFINEVESISKTSHVNVVTLLGFCFERKKRALIYEYMPNKSLDKFICEDGSSPPTGKCLDWSTLNQITVGIARGLEYLHRGCNTRIVHFDIKPQNILLDEDFCPKISDFGLAKLCNKKESIISILGARGTAGYIAPEVFSRHFGRVSHKSDVYSYGMMVLKMAGANKKNISGFSRLSDESYFPDRIYENLENEAGIENEEEGEAARKMILVGLWCIQTIPGDRPSMSKVVEMLEGSVHSLKIPPKPLLHPIETSVEDSYISLQFSSECVTESITGQLS